MFTKCRLISRMRVPLTFALVFALTTTSMFLTSAASNFDLKTTSTFPIAKGEPLGSAEGQVAEDYGRLGLSFEENRGQTDEQVRFLTRGPGYSLFLTANEAVFALRNPDCASQRFEEVRSADVQHEKSPICDLPSQVMRMKIEGANATAMASGEERQPGIVNYFIGNDPEKWHAGIPTFGRVHYDSIYPGVDIVYYGREGQLEYDFIVEPGADWQRVSLAFDGTNSVEVDSATGDLLLKVGKQTLRQHKPLVYQETDGERREVPSGYELKEGRRVGFSVGDYDRSKPLVIDPVLVYSTYLGGRSEDNGKSIAVDSVGGAYVTGETFSPDFPTANPLPMDGGSFDAFVTKLNAAGTARVYSTFLGGDLVDAGTDIAVDSAGSAYITGQTHSSNFPTTANAFQPAPGNGAVDAFVTKLNPSGTALTYSTYLGGTGFDEADAIAVDSAGSAFVTGQTASTDFPTVNPIQALNGGGAIDAFITKLNAAGTALTYSTYLGGNNGDIGGSLTVDSAGNAFVTGQTLSLNFPKANPIFSFLRSANGDAFVAKLNAAGSALTYSTYLGGSNADFGNGIAVDSVGNAYINGFTSSNDFPTANPFQPSLGSTDGDAFVTKLNAAGTALTYSTYLGGSKAEAGNGIAVDLAGNAYIAGSTSSPNFPTVGPYQAVNSGFVDAFVTKLNSSGTLSYSTYLGGSQTDVANGIALDPVGSVYITGETFSANFPTVNPIQLSYSGIADAFVTKIGNLLISGRVINPDETGISDVTVLLTGTHSATTMTNAGGTFQFTLPDNAGTGGSYAITPIKQGFSFSPESQSFGFLFPKENLLFVGTQTGPTPTPTPTTSLVQFEFDSYIALEDCGQFVVAVTRTGNTANALTVDYATSDDTAKQKGDYTSALGTFSFAPGETRKTINVLISEDAFVEGDERFTLNLFNLTGAATLAEPSRAVITITDDDTSGASLNPIDNSLAFVCQHYHDFLNREPDIAGEQFWTNNIESCGNNEECRKARRIDTSAAFFLSIEFQQTGYFVYRFYNAALTRPSGLPRYQEFLHDTQQVGHTVVVGQPNWEANLEASKVAYANDFVARSEYSSVYPLSQTPAQHVDALYTRAGLTPSAAERQAAIDEFGGVLTSENAAARGRVLRRVVENPILTQREFSRAFVLMQYFGYLRRNPDDLPDTNMNGFNFWLGKLNQFGGDFRKAELVNAFLLSAEYRSRFGQP